MSNNGNNPKIVVPAPIMQMKITLLNNNSLSVRGIPNNLDQALLVLSDATKAVVKHFTKKAREGKLDDMDNLIESKIIQPNQKILI